MQGKSGWGSIGRVARCVPLVGLMVLTGSTLPVGENAALAQVVRQPRPPRPTAKPRPTRIPRPTRPNFRHTPVPLATRTPTAVPTRVGATATPTQVIWAPTATATATATPVLAAGVCPGGQPVTCPAPAACKTGNKLGQVYYAYPVSAPIITSKESEIRLHRRSNGIDPEREPASLSLVDKDGNLVVSMPDLRFYAVGNGWRADAPNGWVTMRPKPGGGGYFFQFQYDTPDFPPRYFSVVFQMCFSIGDDGVDEQIVCQEKPRGGILCHNNGTTF